MLLYMCDARGAAGEHHVLAQCAPPVSIFAKYLKTRFSVEHNTTGEHAYTGEHGYVVCSGVTSR